MRLSLDLGLGSVATLNAGVGVRTTPLRVATFGESTADFFLLNGNTDVSAWNYPLDAALRSIEKRNEKAMFAQLYGKAFSVANGGWGGQTTAQMIARSGNAPSATRKAMEDVIALSPDVVVLRAGINGLVGGQTAAAEFSRFQTIINTFADAGIWVIGTGPYGYDAVSNQAAARAGLVDLNTLLAGYSRSRFRYINCAGVTYDASTGAFLSGMTDPTDLVHLNPKAGYLVAELEAAALTNIFGAPDGPRYPGTNVIPNASLSASSSVAYGTLATGWLVGVANGTRANAKIETINGVLMQTCEITPTADNCLGSIDIPFGVFGGSPTIPIVAGDIYGLECDIYFAALDGGPPPFGSFGTRMDLRTASFRNLYTPNSNAFDASMPEAYLGKAVFEPIQFGANSADLTSNTKWSNSFNAGKSGDRTPFKIGTGNARMVKLN